MTPKSELVIIVDDDFRVREAISDLLASRDLASVAFESAAAYLRFGNPDVPSCLVLDVSLPDIDGLELQSTIAPMQHPPIVFISGHGDVPSSVRAMKAGAIDFLAKPVNEDNLLQAINAALNRDRNVRHHRAELAKLEDCYASLTRREREVLPLVVSGLLNKQAAAELGISEVTLQIHRSKVMQKMKARSIADLVRMGQTGPSTRAKAMRVADYIVERLAAEGIDHCFGVAGDYAFPLCDAVDSSAKVKWIGYSNELNASYAADGYARTRGAAMLITTYGVGELSAINGVMGAKAERSLVFHVVGMPSYQNQRVNKIAHHTLGDGVFGNFIHLSAAAACCHAVINPQNCVVEMERVIAEARRNNQPAYIVVPSDYAQSPIAPADVKPIVLRSSEAALKKAMAIIEQRVKEAKSVVAFPAFTLLRLGLRKQTQQAIEALGCPFVTTLMEKCVIDESHAQFAGMYAGAASDPKTRQAVEGADLVLDLGGRQPQRHHHGGLFGQARPVALHHHRPQRRPHRRRRHSRCAPCRRPYGTVQAQARIGALPGNAASETAI
jgi:FixJ family two-component response regulator